MPEPSPNPSSPESAGDQHQADEKFFDSLGMALTESRFEISDPLDPDNPRVMAVLDHKSQHLSVKWHGSMPTTLDCEVENINALCYAVEGILDGTFPAHLRFDSFSETNPEVSFRLTWPEEMLQDFKNAAVALGVWNTEHVIHVIHKADSYDIDEPAGASLYHDKDI